MESMTVYVEIDRDGIVETRGVSGTEDEVREGLRSIVRGHRVLRVRDAHGADVTEERKVAVKCRCGRDAIGRTKHEDRFGRPVIGQWKCMRCLDKEAFALLWRGARFVSVERARSA